MFEAGAAFSDTSRSDDLRVRSSCGMRPVRAICCELRAWGGRAHRGSNEMRPLRYSINVTLDGCCHHEAGLPPDEESMRLPGRAGGPQTQTRTQADPGVDRTTLTSIESSIADVDRLTALKLAQEPMDLHAEVESMIAGDDLDELC